MRPRFLVIGAGPSGIVTAKVLKEHEFRNERVDVVVVEESNQLGGTFVNKTYEGSTLVSSKYITCFSDFREREDVQDHPTITEYVDYLEVFHLQLYLNCFPTFFVSVYPPVSFCRFCQCKFKKSTVFSLFSL